MPSLYFYFVLITRLIIKSTLSQALITFSFISGLFLCQTTNSSCTNDGPTSSIPVKSKVTILPNVIDGNNSLASERDIGYVVLKTSSYITVIFSVILTSNKLLIVIFNQVFHCTTKHFSQTIYSFGVRLVYILIALFVHLN